MKKYTIILSFLLLTITGWAQTGSPSSRLGYGEMADNIPADFRAMGGVTTGMRSNHTINASQPASFTGLDSCSFMFDMAAGIGWTNYKDVYGKKNVPMGSLEYITMQFPLYRRWIAMSVGIQPFTYVKYDFTVQIPEFSSDFDSYAQYYGEGGLSQVYAGISFNILDWFAAGVNGYYMFGNTTNYTLQTFTTSDITGKNVVRYMDMSAFRTRVGAQFFHTIAKNHSFVLGATFDPKLKLGGDNLLIETTTLDTVYSHDGCETPMEWSVGASYTWKNRLTVAADYSFQNWSDALYFGVKGQLKDRHKVSFGAQYQNDPYGFRYYDRMMWRLGASVMNSYTTGTQWQDFTISMGFGFPLRTTATMINTTFEYGQRNSLSGIKEHNMKMIIDVAINEQWFHKRKL